MKNFLVKFLLAANLFFIANAYALEYRDISNNYFLEINLEKKNICQKITGEECFRRDNMRQNPYFHKTIIQIFEGKIVGWQFSKDEENKLVKKFILINDGKFTVTTTNKNLISFESQNGEITSLKILNGIVANESKTPSQCILDEFKYAYYKHYRDDRIIEKSVTYSNEEHFDGIKEVVIYKDTDDYKLRGVHILPSGAYKYVKDLNICQMDSLDETIEGKFLQREISQEECLYSTNKNNLEECLKYKDCRDYLNVKNCEVKTFYDSFKDNSS